MNLCHIGDVVKMALDQFLSALQKEYYMTIQVPPIKCQGIKTKLVPAIIQSVSLPMEGTWIEPFCGSCVVALNVQPMRALLADTNIHIIQLYRAIQQKDITPSLVKEWLVSEGAKLLQHGEQYYYEVRERFNQTGSSLDFLFLNRSCFNGLMRFNKHGKFNVPFGHKPERFRPAYITKIVNQVKAFQQVATRWDWQFMVADFRETLAHATSQDIIYADPPYMGRHVDYYNTWDDTQENYLLQFLQTTPTSFLLSTWESNRYRQNPACAFCWNDARFSIKKIEHFYHVGPTESLRNAMTEALIANYSFPEEEEKEERPINPLQLEFGIG